MKKRTRFNQVISYILVSIMFMYGIQFDSYSVYADEPEMEEPVVVEEIEDTTYEELDSEVVENVEEIEVVEEMDSDEKEIIMDEELIDEEVEEEDVSLEDNNAPGLSFSEAISIGLGTSSEMKLTAGKMSYFKFTPSTTGAYSLETNSAGDTIGYLYSNDQVQLTTDDDSGNSRNFKLSYLLNANTTYYLGVKAYSSSATFNFAVVVNEVPMNGTCGQNLNWSIENGVLTISGNGAMNSFASYSASPWYSFRDLVTGIVVNNGVKTLSNYAFYGMTGARSVSLPDSLQSIGSNAFRSCTSLTSVYIPSSVKTITAASYSNSPFYACNAGMIIYTDAMAKASGWGNYWNYSTANNILSVVYGYSLFEIEYWNSLDKSVAEIVIPDSITSIPSSAFENCTNLTSISIPTSIKSIGSNAFTNCTSLSSIYIPSSVENIFASAYAQSPFYGCSKDLLIYTDAASCPSGWQTYWDYRDLKDELSVVYNYSQAQNNYWKTLTGNETEIVLPNYITSIPNYAFAGFENLVSITLPDTITSIGSFAFYNCINLESIEIPASVVNMGSYTFYNCTNLRNVALNGSMEAIKDHSFENCSSLNSIIIPANVTYVGWSAFKNCTQLTNITFPKATYIVEDSALDGCINLKNIYLYKKSRIAKRFDANLYNIIFVDVDASTYQYTLEGYSLSLNNSMGLNFYFTFGQEILSDEGSYVLVDNGQTVEKILIQDMNPEVNGYYVVCASVSVKDLFDNVHVALYTSTNQYVAQFDYSANQYLEYIITHEGQYPAYINIVKAIMNYSISAQNYFNGPGASVVNSYEDADLSQYQAQLNSMIDYKGTKLLLKSQLGLKFYFANGTEFKVDGQSVEVKEENGYKVVEIENINVADIDKYYSITVDGNEMKYSLLSYGFMGLQTNHQDLKDLINSLYYYFDSLNKYKGNVQATLDVAKQQLASITETYTNTGNIIESGIISYYEAILNSPNATQRQKEDAQNAINTLNRHSNDRLTYIDNPTTAQIRNYSTNIGGQGDATSWTNSLLLSKEAMNKCNVLRNSENLDNLLTSCYMMATAQVQANASSFFIGHSRLENVGENLFWTYIGANGDLYTPQEVVNHIYKGWYTDEKLVYDYLLEHPNATAAEVVKACGLPNESYVQTGHYTNIIGNYTSSGFGMNTNGMKNGSGYEYTYSQTFSSNNSYTVYTVDQFMDGAINYYNSVINTYIEAANQYNQLSNLVGQLEASLKSSGMIR